MRGAQIEWLHFDLWSSAFFLSRGLSLGCPVSALVWFGLAYLPSAPTTPPVPCVSVSTLYSETYLHV